MKFPEFNSAHTHTLHIPSLANGLDNNENPHNQADVGLADCKNVFKERGLLKTRLGLSTSLDRQLNAGEYEDGLYSTYKSQNLQVEIDGEIKQLVTQLIDYDISSQHCLTHFINPGGSIHKTASIDFFRTTDDTFYIPERINFFKGAPKTGGGLFAIVGLVNCENYSQNDARIYEISTDFSVWSQVPSLYTPTVLINGRGNKYEFAKGTNQAFTGTPKILEGLNVLNSRFYAYYSTDGYSSSFRLPFSGLAQKSVIGRLYYSVDSYVDWLIEENQTSAEATLYGTAVTMHVDREKGIVFFTVPAGEYEMPLVSNQNENNLRISACKTCEYSFFDMSYAKASATCDQHILLGAENTVFEANCKNPLYFPLDSTLKIGSEGSSITAFSTLGSQIFAFNQNEIYSISVENGKKLDDVSLLTNSNAGFNTCDILKSKCLERGVGCKSGASLLNANGNLYWLSPDLKMQSISSSGKVSLLENQPDLQLLLGLNTYSEIYGTAWNSKCLFLCDNRGVLMDCENSKEIQWYYWEFPSAIRFAGAYTLYGKPQFLCLNPTDALCFTADLTSDTDSFLTLENQTEVLATAPISALARTKKISFGCDNTFKKLDSVTLNFKGEAKVSINDRLQARLNSQKQAPFRLTPALCQVNLMDIALASNTPFALGSVDIGYTTLSL